jgi:cytidine deaminase
MEEDRELIERAKAVRRYAHTPYSNFKVGAAILGKSGRIYDGCNVESSSFNLTLCAERVALFKAVSEGEKEFKKIAIVTESGSSPCGACRQVLWDIAKDIEVITVNNNGEIETFNLKDLLPSPFGSKDLITEKDKK